MNTTLVGQHAQLLEQHGIEFALEVHGAVVECHVTEAALDRWCAELCCDRANVRRLRRIAQEVLDPELRRVDAQPGERWGAHIGDGLVALSVTDE